MNRNVLKSLLITLLALVLLCGCPLLGWAAFAIGFEVLAADISIELLKALLELLTNPDVVLGGCGVIIAVLAVAVTVIVYEGQSADQRRKESMERLIAHDPLNAVKKILTEDWGSSSWEHLRSEETFERRALTQLNQLCEHTDPADSLKMLGEFYATTELRGLTNCCSEKFQQKIECAFWLWQHFDEDARNIVIRLLKEIDNADERASLVGRFERGKENELRLLRDQRPGFELGHIARHLLVYKYDWQSWAPLWSSDPRPIDESMRNWLDLAGLTSHPFPVITGRDDHLLLENWVHPDKWDRMLDTKPIMICSDDGYDRVATAYKLCDALRDYPYKSNAAEVEQKYFPILLELPMSSLPPNATAIEALHGIARTIGETWINLLSRHPWAFLELDPVQEAGLAQFLLWTTDSVVLLKRKLDRAFDLLPKTAENVIPQAARDMLKQRLEALQNDSLPRLPSSSQLLEWISYRPPGLSRSYLIAYFGEDAGPIQGDLQAKAMMEWAWHLSKINVSLKLFTPEYVVEQARRSDSIDLGWSNQSLMEALDLRVANACGQGWADLVVPWAAVAMVEQLVEKAGESYGRMVRIAHEAIRIHVQRTPDKKHLTPDDQVDAISSIL